MAHVKLDGGFMALPINIKRGNPIPLDSSSVHYPTFDNDGNITVSAFDNAKEYATNSPVSYVGQIITVCEGIIDNGNFVVQANDNTGVYYIADEKGTLIKLVNTNIIEDEKDKEREDIEIDYNNNLIPYIHNIDGEEKRYTIIISKGSYKKGTSDLFINGIKYNNTEYQEIYYEAQESGFTIDDTAEICNGILFEYFDVIQGDEVTILADYE